MVSAMVFHTNIFCLQQCIAIGLQLSYVFVFLSDIEYKSVFLLTSVYVSVTWEKYPIVDVTWYLMETYMDQMLTR